jgi:O-antigen ligase
MAAFCTAGFFWLWHLREKSGHRLWLVLAAPCLLLLGTLASPRAGIVAMCLVTLLWIVARGFRILAFQVCVAGLALVLVISSALVIKKDLRETEAYSAYEKIVSIFDYHGKGTYLHNQSGDPGDNNQFRLVWWRELTKETLKRNPVFGLGFGYDLAAGFLAEYDLVSAEDFSARSPHSVIFSVLGRMGILGLLLWLGIIACMARAFVRDFRSRDLSALGLWSIVWVFLICACAGVVIEGPMGAVVFWTALGLAKAGQPELTDDKSDAALSRSA